MEEFENNKELTSDIDKIDLIKHDEYNTGQDINKVLVTAEETRNGDNYDIYYSDTDLENLASNSIKQSGNGKQCSDGYDIKKKEAGEQNHGNSKIEINENDDDISQYDAFGEGNRLYRKYPLRQPKPKGIKVEKQPLKLHKDNSDDEMFQLECETCHAAFQTKTGLLNHMRMHQRIAVYNCSICPERFETNSNLISHKKKHENENHTFSCKKCKLAFSNHLDYLLHQVKHMKNSVCRCKECGKVLKSKTGFTIHIQTHFDKRHECHICNKLYRGEINIKKHLKTHVDIVECGECGKRCKDAPYLKYHMISHTGVKRHQCLYCGKGFPNSQQKQVHTRTHTNEKPYECKICLKKCRQQTDFNRHVLSHSGMKYECKICKKKFRSKQWVATHMRRHTKTGLYKCKQCDMSCVSSGSLKSHVLFHHTAEKAFKCEVCGLEFKLRNDLKRHFRSKKHKNMTFGENIKNKEINT